MLETRGIEDKMALLRNFFASQKGIVAVYLFGSYGTEHQMPFSDIDLAVIFDRELSIGLREEMGLEASLSLFLGEERVDLVNLNRAQVKLQFRAVSEGRLIFEGDESAHSAFLEGVYNAYGDYEPDLRYYHEEYRKALEEAYGP